MFANTFTYNTRQGKARHTTSARQKHWALLATTGKASWGHNTYLAYFTIHKITSKEQDQQLRLTWPSSQLSSTELSMLSHAAARVYIQNTRIHITATSKLIHCARVRENSTCPLPLNQKMAVTVIARRVELASSLSSWLLLSPSSCSLCVLDIVTVGMEHWKKNHKRESE